MRGLETTMKNDLQNLTEDISRLYEDITQKAQYIGQIDSITRLYDELQAQLLGIRTEEVDLLHSHMKSTRDQLAGLSQSLAHMKTLTTTLHGGNEVELLTEKARPGE